MSGPFDIPASWIVLGVLIATSSSLMGLLAIWAAWSPRHWFLRTAVVAGVLLLAVPIPAYEPMLVFLIQAIVVTAALTVVEARRASRPRFSLSTLLLLVAIAAVTFAVGARIPAEVWAAWVPILGGGMFLASNTLVATWATQRRRRWSTRAIVLFAMTPLVSIPLALAVAALSDLDMLIFGLWIQVVFYGLNVGAFDWSFTSVLLSAIWATALAWSTALPIFLWLILCRLSLNTKREHFLLNRGKDEPSRTPSRWATPARLALALLTLAMLLPPAAVYWPLVNPTPKPEVVLPSPNAYDDLVQAGVALTSNVISNYDTAGKGALQSELSQLAAALAQAHTALDREFRLPLTYTSDDVPMNDFQAFRQIARAFTAEAGLAMMDGHAGDAARIHVDTMRLGRAVSKDGLLVHCLVGNAIEGIGADGIVGLRAQVTPAQAKDLVARLETLAVGPEPIDDVIARDHVWAEYAYGWIGRLILAIERVTGESSLSGPAVEAFRNASDREATQLRLLIADLAVRGYRLEHGELPATLSVLVPDYIAAVPFDPYGDGPLTYRVTEDSYLLYSVWRDGNDDGGQSVPRDNLWSDGDFLVDTLYQRTPPATGQTQPVKQDADDGEEVE